LKRGPDFINLNICYFRRRQSSAPSNCWGDAKATVAQLIEELETTGLSPRGTGQGPRYRSKEPYFAEIQRERRYLD